MKYTKYISALCCIALLSLSAALWKIDKLQSSNDLLALERDQAVGTAAKWEKTAATHARNTELEKDIAQACLDRELHAVDMTEQWQEIMNNAQIRDTSETEQKGVPDNATRRKLYTDLDRPL